MRRISVVVALAATLPTLDTAAGASTGSDPAGAPFICRATGDHARFTRNPTALPRGFPVDKAVQLFGGVTGLGAQAPKLDSRPEDLGALMSVTFGRATVR